MTALASLPRFSTDHGVVYVATRPQVEAYEPWRSSFANQRKDWRYYQIVEDTILQGFDYRYFILEDAAGAVRAVQPFFLLDQDLLQGSGELARNLVAKVRATAPQGADDADADGRLRRRRGPPGPRVRRTGRVGRQTACTGRCARYARQQKCGLVVLKEFPHHYRRPLKSFAGNGYARVPSLPMTRLSIDFASFDEYMTKALSKVTRKGLRRKFRDAEAAAPIELSVVEDVTPFVDEVYPLYLKVYQKSPLQFEKLTREYLCRLGQEMPDKARFFIWRQNGKAIAFSVCLVNGDTIYDEYLGLDYAVALDLHLYFYTLRDIVSWAMEHGYKWYCSSALNYDPKLHLKCELVPLDLYVAHTSAVPNFFLRRILPLLEPTRNDKTLQKFPNFAAVWGGGMSESAIAAVVAGRSPEPPIGGHHDLRPMPAARAAAGPPAWFLNPYVQLGIGSLLVTVSELLMKRAPATPATARSAGSASPPSPPAGPGRASSPMSSAF